MEKETPISFEADLIQTHQQDPQKQAELESINGGHDEEEKQIRREGEERESGRERLKRCRVEMTGRVWIPDIWGQEEFMKDWIDCTGFDAALVRSDILSARTALIEEEGSRTRPRSRLITSP